MAPLIGFASHFTYFLALVQLLQHAFASKYVSLPERPLPLSLKHSNVKFDHVTLPYDVTVIAYHDIMDSEVSSHESTSDNNGSFDVLLQNFVDQMTYLEVNGYHTISVTELFAYLTGNMVLPPRSVLLTFQEGKKGVWNYAYSLLREKKFYAAIFVSPNNIQGQEKTPNGPYMTLNQLKVMDNDPLFETYPCGKSSMILAHEDLTGDTLIEELRGSRQWLEEQLGGSRPYFAWPKGAYNRVALNFAKQYYNLSFALDQQPQTYLNAIHRIPRFVPRRQYDLPTFLKVLKEQQPDLGQHSENQGLPHCFDLEVEVQGQELQQAMRLGFVPCSDVMFHANRLVSSHQMASLCVNIKKGLGLDGKDLEISEEVATSSMVTRADVVVSFYRCAKEAWLDFTQELPKVEIMNPFSDINGSVYNGVVVALAGLCDVSAPPNDRGDHFLPGDWSSRGNAVVASWRMLGCLRNLISPTDTFANSFQSEEGIWKWLPSDTHPKAKDYASVAVAASAGTVKHNFHFIIPAAFFMKICVLTLLA